jgi:nitroreductase
MPTPNPAAMAFLAQRRSRPAKTMVHPVPSQAQVTHILATATRVPDHGKLEPWRFLVLTPDAMPRMAALAETHARQIGADAEKIGKARGQYDLGLLAIVVISSPKPSDKVPAIEQLLSAGALCQNILNAAEAAGWGANWLTGWPAHDAAFCATAFGTQPHESIAGIIHLATETPLAPDRPRPDVATLTTWMTA